MYRIEQIMTPTVLFNDSASTYSIIIFRILPDCQSGFDMNRRIYTDFNKS